MTQESINGQRVVDDARVEECKWVLLTPYYSVLSSAILVRTLGPVPGDFQ